MKRPQKELEKIFANDMMDMGLIFNIYKQLMQHNIKKILPQFMSKNVLPMFFFRRLMVSGLTFSSLINFEFSFVCGVRECSNFILLHVVCPVFQAQLIEETSFYCIFLPPLS